MKESRYLMDSRPMDACECGLCAVCNCWLKRPDWQQQKPWMTPEEITALVDRCLEPVRKALR